MKHQSLKGVLFMVAAATLWSLGGVLTKSIPFDALTISLVRGTLAAVMIGLAKGSFTIVWSRIHIQAGFFIFITTVLFIYANTLTTAANAIMLQYTSILFIIVLNKLFYNIKAHRIEKRTFVIVLIGMILFFFQDLNYGEQLGNLLALGSGIGFAFVFVLHKHPRAQPLESIYLGQLLSLILLPMLWLDSSLTLEPLPWVLLVFMGLIQLGLAYVFFAKGIKLISALRANLITTIEPILNPLWVFLVLGERIHPFSLVGGALILGAITWMNISITKLTHHDDKLEATKIT